MTAAQAQLTLDAGQRSGDADQRPAERDLMVAAVDVRPTVPAPKGPLARFVDRILKLGLVR